MIELAACIEAKRNFTQERECMAMQPDPAPTRAERRSPLMIDHFFPPSRVNEFSNVVKRYSDQFSCIPAILSISSRFVPAAGERERAPVSPLTERASVHIGTRVQARIRTHVTEQRTIQEPAGRKQESVGDG